MPVWLKAVPWSAILSNAPLILSGAKKLAALVKNVPEGAFDGRPADNMAFKEGAPPDIAALQARILQLEEKQRQGAELLRAMAETNAQMAAALEDLRGRTRFNGTIAAIALVGLIVLALWWWSHT